MKKKDFQSPEFKRAQAIKHYHIGGRAVARIAYGYERDGFTEDADDECANCGVPTGFLHLLPCDLEQCPSCHGQALGCSCAYEKRPDER